MSGKQTAVQLSVAKGIASVVLNRPEEGNRIGDDFITARVCARLVSPYAEECSEVPREAGVVVDHGDHRTPWVGP